MRPVSYTLQEISDRSAIHFTKYQTGQLYIAGSIRPVSYYHYFTLAVFWLGTKTKCYFL